MKLFSILGIEFGISFVVDDIQQVLDLTELAYEWNIELEDQGMRDGCMLLTISEVGGEINDSGDPQIYSRTDLVEGFLKALREEPGWVQDRDVVNGNKVIIFYREEALK